MRGSSWDVAFEHPAYCLGPRKEALEVLLASADHRFSLRDRTKAYTGSIIVTATVYVLEAPEVWLRLSISARWRQRQGIQPRLGAGRWAA